MPLMNIFVDRLMREEDTILTLADIFQISVEDVFIINGDDEYLWNDQPKLVCRYYSLCEGEIPYEHEFPLALDISIDPVLLNTDSLWVARRFSAVGRVRVLVDALTPDEDARNPYVMWLVDQTGQIQRVKLDFTAFDADPSRYVIDISQPTTVIR